MVAHDVLELRGQAQLGQPDRRLVGLEHGMGQLQVQQPVVLHLRLRPVVEDQELLLRLLPQHPVFQPELVVGDLDLFHAVQRHRLELVPHVARGIVPEDDPVLLEQALQSVGDPVAHSLSPGIFFRAAPNFG